MSPPATADSQPSTRLLKDRQRRVFRHLPKALAGDENALHQLRVWGRRLRVGLPVLARKPAGRRARRALKILRQVTRTAGGSRDLDVMVGLMDARLKELRVHPEPLKVLRRRLLDARGRSRRRMAEGLLDLEIARLRRDLRAIVGRRGEALFTVLLRLRQSREAEGEAVLAGLARLEDGFDPEALHRLRIRVRRLRYLAELLDAVRGQPSEAAGLFKQLQDGLGQLHDNFLLSEWAAAQATRSASRGQAELSAQAAALAEHFRARARELHREVLALRPAELVGQGLQVMGRTRGAA